jgi:hypothetical protein
VPSYEELEQALQEWMNPENSTASDDDNATSTQASSTLTSKAQTATAPKHEDIESAFNDLFNN